MKRIVWISALVIPVLLFSCERLSPDWQNLDVEWSPISDCKDMGLKTGPPSGQDCISYEYLNDSVLSIRHENAGFNCCPDRIVIEVEYRNDTVFVIESEVDAFCDCNCLYDIEYVISPVPAKEFIFSVQEAISYRTGEDPLVFEIDLQENTSGEFCVSRSSYPWL